MNGTNGYNENGLHVKHMSEGECVLCPRPKNGEAWIVKGIAGLKTMILCTDHMKLIGKQKDEEKPEEAVTDWAKAN